MAKHGKKKEDVTETRGNPVIRALKNSKTPVDKTRLEKDIEIIDKGWNNTEEGKTDLATKGASRTKGSGKHKK